MTILNIQINDLEDDAEKKESKLRDYLDNVLKIHYIIDCSHRWAGNIKYYMTTYQIEYYDTEDVEDNKKLDQKIDELIEECEEDEEPDIRDQEDWYDKLKTFCEEHDIDFDTDDPY